MTREEAEIRIGELGMYARTQGWDDEYTEAVNMAIKALEQEPKYFPPCINCNEKQDKIIRAYNKVMGLD